MYKIRDEKGELRTLNYKGGTEAVDETGAVWVTQNNGITFRKRDLYIYTDSNGHKEYLNDPYGSTGTVTPSHLVDKNGKAYSYDSFGVLKEVRLENYDDGSPKEIIETFRLNKSEERPVEK